MKKYLLVLMLLITGVIYSQDANELVLKYDMILSLNKPKKYNAVLNYSDNKATFYWNDHTKKAEETNIEVTDEGNYEFEIIIEDSIGTINQVNFITDTIMSRFLHLGTPKILKEKRPIINWKITADTKNIDNFKCNKAIGNFRGRTYVVWFTSQIPAPIGPWKLQGLPGAILEAYDTDKLVQFYIKSISNQPKQSVDYNKIFKKGDCVNLKEYAKEQSEYTTELIRKLKAKLPRNVKITNVTTSEFLEKTFNN